MIRSGSAARPPSSWVRIRPAPCCSARCASCAGCRPTPSRRSAPARAMHPRPLSEAERERYSDGTLEGAPDHVRGDYPEWLAGPFASCLRRRRPPTRAARWRGARPVDLRVNTLKVDRDKALRSLAHLRPEPTAARTGRAADRGRRGRPGARPSRPSPPMSKASSRCRTRARRSPPWSAAPSPACRCSTCAPAAAARRWPWLP